MASTLPKLLKHADHKRNDIRVSHLAVRQIEWWQRGLVALTLLALALLLLSFAWKVGVVVGLEMFLLATLEVLHKRKARHWDRIRKNRLELHDAMLRIKAKRNRIAQERFHEALAKSNRESKQELNKVLTRRHRSCGVKRQHPNVTAAHRHMAQLGKKAAGMHAYRCDYCGWWHVGHPTQKGADLWG